MKKLSVILILLVSIGFGQVMIPDTSKMTNTEKMMWYQNEKKSPFLSIWLNSIPTAGYAYAGDWKRGLKIKGAEILMLFGGVGIHGINSKKVPHPNPYLAERGRTDIEYDSFFSSVGSLIMLGAIITRMWEFYDVAKTAKKYNTQLYKNLFGTPPSMQFSLIPQPKGIGLGLSYNF